MMSESYMQSQREAQLSAETINRLLGQSDHFDNMSDDELENGLALINKAKDMFAGPLRERVEVMEENILREIEKRQNDGRINAALQVLFGWQNEQATQPTEATHLPQEPRIVEVVIDGRRERVDLNTIPQDRQYLFTQQDKTFDNEDMGELERRFDTKEQAVQVSQPEDAPIEQLSFSDDELPPGFNSSSAADKPEGQTNWNILRTALRPRTLVLGSVTLALAGGTAAAFAMNSSSETPIAINECFDENDDAEPLVSGNMAINGDVIWKYGDEELDLNDPETGEPAPLQLDLATNPIDYTICLPENSDDAAYVVEGDTVTVDRDALVLQAISRADLASADPELWQTLDPESLAAAVEAGLFDQKTADTLSANMNDDENEAMAARIALAQVANEIENGTSTFNVTDAEGEAREISVPATIIKSVEDAFTESVEAAYPNKTILYEGSFGSVDFVGTSAPQTDLFTIEDSQLQQFNIETNEIEK